MTGTKRLTVSQIHYIGDELLREGRFLEAIEIFREALGTDPDNHVYWYRMGQCLEKSERGQEAYLSFERALKIDPENAGYWNSFGRTLSLLGNFREAAKAFEEALKIDPDHPDACFNLREVRLQLSTGAESSAELQFACDSSDDFSLEEFDALIERTRSAVKESPADLSLKLRLSKLLERKGNLKEATKLLRKVLQYDSNNLAALSALADYSLSMGQLDQAIVCLQRMIAIDQSDFRTYIRLGQVLLSSQHFEAATSITRIALELAPENSQSWSLWAQIMERINDTGCYSAYLRAAELARFDAELWYKVGSIAAKRGDRGNAVMALRQAVAMAPCNSKMWLALGRVLEDIGNTVDAEAVYQQVISFDPMDATAWNALGALYSLNGDKSNAEKALRKAIDLAPDFPNPWYNLRDILMSRGDLKGADEARMCALASAARRKVI